MRIAKIIGTLALAAGLASAGVTTAVAAAAPAQPSAPSSADKGVSCALSAFTGQVQITVGRQKTRLAGKPWHDSVVVLVVGSPATKDKEDQAHGGRYALAFGDVRTLRNGTLTSGGLDGTVGIGTPGQPSIKQAHPTKARPCVGTDVGDGLPLNASVWNGKAPAVYVDSSAPASSSSQPCKKSLMSYAKTLKKVGVDQPATTSLACTVR